jgi:hypothetical protein
MATYHSIFGPHNSFEYCKHCGKKESEL